MNLDDAMFVEGVGCRSCGELALCWSRSRELKEDLVRTFLPGSYYRCQLCDWRGLMFHRESFGEWRYRIWHSAWTLMLLLFLVICGVIGAFGLLRNSGMGSSGAAGAQTQPVPAPAEHPQGQ